MGLSDIFISVDSLPDGGYGFIQLLFLTAVYGYILYTASNMISDGSELLLLIPSLAGLVGSVVLPVLGAVPDGAIVLFSGMGPDAQEQLSVGVGALAGSTVMLLTIPWFLSVYAGRVDIRNGVAKYSKPKLTDATSFWTSQGVEGTAAVAQGAKIMMVTALLYLIIQVPASSIHGPEEEIALGEHSYALAGVIICFVAFVMYLVYQYREASASSSLEKNAHELRVDAVIVDKIKAGEISLRAALVDVAAATTVGDSESTPLNGGHDPLIARLKVILKPFFAMYDKDHSGFIDRKELSLIMRDMHVHEDAAQLEQRFQKYDVDRDGTLDFMELVRGTAEVVRDPAAVARMAGSTHGEEEDDEEDDEEIPEEFLDLPPEQQQRRIFLRSCQLMGVGTLLVILFSDPMVDALSELGNRTGVSPFYVSFVLAPLASNASELLASYTYALKKTTKSITISLTALEGAGICNNCFCLGIFMVLIYVKGLAWEFTAETIAILVAEVIVGVIALFRVQKMWMAAAVLAVYPLSLLLVAVLEAHGLD